MSRPPTSACPSKAPTKRTRTVIECIIRGPISLFVDGGRLAILALPQAQRLIASGWMAPGDASPWQPGRQEWRRHSGAGAELRLLDVAEARFVSRGGLKLEGALKLAGLSVRGCSAWTWASPRAGLRIACWSGGAARGGRGCGARPVARAAARRPRVVCLEGLNARALTPQTWRPRGRCASEDIEDEEDSETESPWPRMPGCAMAARWDRLRRQRRRQGATTIEAFKAERARAKSAPRARCPVQRRRKAEFADQQLNPGFDLVTGTCPSSRSRWCCPALVPLLAPQGHLLMLVKPQFELQPGQVGKGGIVRDPALYAQVEQRLRETCAQPGAAGARLVRHRPLRWRRQPRIFLHATLK